MGRPHPARMGRRPAQPDSRGTRLGQRDVRASVRSGILGPAGGDGNLRLHERLWNSHPNLGELERERAANRRQPRLRVGTIRPEQRPHMRPPHDVLFQLRRGSLQRLACPSNSRTEPQGLAEKTERVLKLQSGYTNVSLITPGSTTTKTTKGVVSFSKTTDEDADGYRPFFLGSFGVEREGLWGHSDTCPDGSTLQLSIKDLSIDMLQPTFGIEEVATGQIGVPRRAPDAGDVRSEWRKLRDRRLNDVYSKPRSSTSKPPTSMHSVVAATSELPVVARLNVKYGQVLAIRRK